jgi:hypothetical protein
LLIQAAEFVQNSTTVHVFLRISSSSPTSFLFIAPSLPTLKFLACRAFEKPSEELMEKEQVPKLHL